MKAAVLFLLAALTALAALAAEKPRVFIAESDSWELSGRGGGVEAVAAGVTRGGARPQTVEIMKTFAQRCPAVSVTLDRDKADYVVLLEHEGGKGSFRRDNKVAVFNQERDMIYSGSTRSLGNAVKNACLTITGPAGK